MGRRSPFPPAQPVVSGPAPEPGSTVRQVVETRTEVDPPRGAQTARPPTVEEFQHSRWEVNRMVRGAPRYLMTVDGQPTARTLADYKCKAGTYICHPIGANGRPVIGITETLFIDDDPNNADTDRPSEPSEPPYDEDDEDDEPPATDALTTMLIADRREAGRAQIQAMAQQSNMLAMVMQQGQNQMQMFMQMMQTQAAQAQAQAQALYGLVGQLVQAPAPPAIPPVVEQALVRALNPAPAPVAQSNPMELAFGFMQRMDETIERRVELAQRVRDNDDMRREDEEQSTSERVMGKTIEKVVDRFLPGPGGGAAPPSPDQMRAVVLQVASDPVQVRGLLQTDPQKFAAVLVQAIRGDPALEDALAAAIQATNPPSPDPPPSPPPNGAVVAEAPVVVPAAPTAQG